MQKLDLMDSLSYDLLEARCPSDLLKLLAKQETVLNAIRPPTEPTPIGQPLLEVPRGVGGEQRAVLKAFHGLLPLPTQVTTGVAGSVGIHIPNAGEALTGVKIRSHHLLPGPRQPPV